ncbi:hypothetical protein HD554DRAFT_2075735 [Boletus coccyginus]|nr:hypothetical protein HD554DRAFT_2075735 [Boletus coccyginus]
MFKPHERPTLVCPHPFAKLFLFLFTRSLLVLLYLVLGANELDFLFCRYPSSLPWALFFPLAYMVYYEVPVVMFELVACSCSNKYEACRFSEPESCILTFSPALLCHCSPSTP